MTPTKTIKFILRIPIGIIGTVGSPLIFSLEYLMEDEATIIDSMNQTVAFIHHCWFGS